MKHALWLLLACAACAGRPVDPRAGNANAPGQQCAPGQVNAKGVGKPCHSREDCAGLWANFCDIVVSPRRPPMCSRICDSDTDCGENAMCGVINGVRHCYPKVCTQWTWTPGCRKWNPWCQDPRKAGEDDDDDDDDEARHDGALICFGGVAFSEDDFGKRCNKDSHARNGEVCTRKSAPACEATFNPDGPDYCTHECWNDKICGSYGYCGYHLPVKSFSQCWPRCPEDDHRAIRQRPAGMDLCLAENSPTAAGQHGMPPNEIGVGVRCKSDADCAGNAQAKTCGSSVPGQRKPDVCTVSCQHDADCGRNAACVDLDWNLRGDGKASGQKRFCLPACWAQ